LHPEPHGAPDAALDAALDAARDGAPGAFAELYGPLAGGVHAYFAAQGVGDAVESTSEVFLRVLHRIDEFSGGAALLRTWLFTVAHRLVDEERKMTDRRKRVSRFAVIVTATEHADEAPVAAARGALAVSVDNLFGVLDRGSARSPRARGRCHRAQGTHAAGRGDARRHTGGRHMNRTAIRVEDPDAMIDGRVATLDPRLGAVSAALARIRAQAAIDAGTAPAPNSELRALLHDAASAKASRLMPLRAMALDGTLLPREPRKQSRWSGVSLSRRRGARGRR
jgi:DNA-directed RNA polymerase specialized sigma24 family protein